MRIIFFSLISFFLLQNARSQKVNLDLFKNMKPRSIGPAGMSGRVTAIDAVVSEPDIIYVGQRPEWPVVLEHETRLS